MAISQSLALAQLGDEIDAYDAYTSLNPFRREIRLLTIGPGLKCNLVTASLDDKPHYYALSYYWGAPSETIAVDIDGTPFLLRKTLYAFFEQLQRHYRELTVWVDVICINQKDKVEQGQQVTMMADIYRDAAAVYAWLGIGDADSDYLMKYVQTPTMAGLDLPSRQRLSQYLNRLLEYPYFQRAWIIQECSLNETLLLFCGRYLVSWTTLWRTNENMISMATDANNSNIGTPFFVTAKQEETCLDLIQQSRKANHGRLERLLDVAYRLRHTKCLDPRDKLYAFRGLSTHADGLSVDYSKPAVHALFETILLCQPIESRDLDKILQLIEILQPSSSDLHSAMQHYSKTGFIMVFANIGFTTHPDDEHKFYGPPESTGRTSPTLAFVGCEKDLHGSGPIGRLVWLFCTYEEDLIHHRSSVFPYKGRCTQKCSKDYGQCFLATNWRQSGCSAGVGRICKNQTNTPIRIDVHIEFGALLTLLHRLANKQVPGGDLHAAWPITTLTRDQYKPWTFIVSSEASELECNCA
jgi:hypothetical protein